jgi:hypothetical protein
VVGYFETALSSVRAWSISSYGYVGMAAVVISGDVAAETGRSVKPAMMAAESWRGSRSERVASTPRGFTFDATEAELEDLRADRSDALADNRDRWLYPPYS